jgi:hypothetical protein
MKGFFCYPVIVIMQREHEIIDRRGILNKAHQSSHKALTVILPEMHGQVSQIVIMHLLKNDISLRSSHGNSVKIERMQVLLNLVGDPWYLGRIHTFKDSQHVHFIFLDNFLKHSILQVTL